LSRSVPVSEIISVREEDEESGSRRKDDGSWKKIKDGDGTDCRKSFTGTGTNNPEGQPAPGPRRWSPSFRGRQADRTSASTARTRTTPAQTPTPQVHLFHTTPPTRAVPG
ncbi:hypothetical protein ATANTOWER_026843, partial [Ataeniobius toweri]|nr:hypothetical protein [Ataeniobius toweri]